MAPAMIPGASIDRSKGRHMTIDPKQFAEHFSELTNALQAALFLAGQRATAARTETAECDQLYATVARAVEAARQLRAAGTDQKGGRDHA